MLGRAVSGGQFEHSRHHRNDCRRDAKRGAYWIKESHQLLGGDRALWSRHEYFKQKCKTRLKRYEPTGRVGQRLAAYRPNEQSARMKCGRNRAGENDAWNCVWQKQRG